MLPDDFCGPSYFVSGCTFDVENEYDSWRVYAHQYKDVGGRQRQGRAASTPTSYSTPWAIASRTFPARNSER